MINNFRGVYLMHKKYQKLIGSVIKGERCHQNLTAEKLADSVYISKSYLTKIENAYCAGSQSAIYEIFRELRIDFTMDEESLNFMNQYLIDFYYAFINEDKDQIKQYYEIINEQSEKYYYSYLRHRYYLVCLLWFIEQQELDEAFEMKNKIETMQELVEMTELEKQVFLTGVGYLYLQENRLADAIVTLNEAKKIGKFANSYSLVCYYLGIAYDRDKQLINAICMTKEAIDFFQNELNFKKQLFSYLHIAYLYSYDQQYESSNQIIEYVLKQSKFLRMKSVENYCGQLLINNCLAQKDFKQAKVLLDDLKNNDCLKEVKETIYVYGALTEYNLKNFDRSLQWIHEGVGICKNKVVMAELEALKHMIEIEDDEKILKMLKKEYRELSAILDNQGKRFFINQIVEQSNKLHRYKDAYHYYKSYYK